MSVALNWQSVRPAVPIGKVSGYFDVPAFSFDSQWLGASVIVAQYNLSLDRNFVLRNRPTKPANANCLLVIRYRVGSTVYRYKLWEDVNCTLVADLYNGQVIKKNCVIEIWNLSTSTNSSQATVMRLYTGLMQVVTDFSTAPVDYAGATAALQQDQFNVNAYPIYATGLVARYDAAIGVRTTGAFTMNQWLDAVSGGLPLVANGAADCAYLPAGDVSTRFINFKPFITFGVGIILNGAFPLTANGGLGTIYMVSNVFGWTLNEFLIYISKTGTFKFGLSDRGISPQVQLLAGNPANFSASSSALPVGQNDAWHIIKLTISNVAGAGFLDFQVDDLASVFTGDNAGDSLGAIEMTLGTIGAIAEALFYSQAVVSGSAEDIAIKSYLAAKFSIAYPLPLIFSDNNPWLSNA